MPSTANYALPYPAATDPPNIPAHVQALAVATDAALLNKSTRVVSSTSDVSAPYAGMLVFSTSNLMLYRYTGSAWVLLGSDTPVCKAVMNSTQSIPNNADTDIAFNTAEENWTDPISGLAMWDSANPTRVVIRKDGYYRFTAEDHYAIGGSGSKRAMTITRNNIGTPTNASTIANATRSSDTVITNTLTASGGKRCVAGDIIRVSTYQNNGAGLNIVGNGIEGVCFLEAVWVKP